jgi:hypothetical protein
VAQPTVNANRGMMLIILNKTRTSFMIFSSFRVALFFDLPSTAIRSAQASQFAPEVCAKQGLSDPAFCLSGLLPNSWTLVVLPLPFGS